MFLGDVVESIFKGILRAMKVEFEDNGKIDIILRVKTLVVSMT